MVVLVVVVVVVVLVLVLLVVTVVLLLLVVVVLLLLLVVVWCHRGAAGRHRRSLRSHRIRRRGIAVRRTHESLGQGQHPDLAGADT